MVDHAHDRVRARDQREEAHHDKEDGRDREEGAVGERGREHHHVVVEELLASADDDRLPVREGEVA